VSSPLLTADGTLRQGLAVLRDAPFNGSHGWEHIGPPSVVVPAEDHAWLKQPGMQRYAHVHRCTRIQFRQFLPRNFVLLALTTP
jgi:hypothetical protein